MAGEKKVGVALDFVETSKAALTWAIDSLIKLRDTLVVIHVLPADKGIRRRTSWLQSGAPMLPLRELKNPALMRRFDVKPDKEVLKMLDAVTSQKDARVMAKLYWGDAGEKLCQAVVDLQLDSIVMGSRCLGSIQRTLLGRVSNYVIINAPCPVTIVKDAAPQVIS